MHHQISNYIAPSSLPQAIIAVSQHPRKIKTRGYNQSLVLSKHLCKFLNCNNLNHLVVKHKATDDQAKLALSKRKQNIKGAFKVIGQLPKHVAIVDDVMTSSHTVFELARTLKKHGVDKVDVWCLARAC